MGPCLADWEGMRGHPCPQTLTLCSLSRNLPPPNAPKELLLSQLCPTALPLLQPHTLWKCSPSRQDSPPETFLTHCGPRNISTPSPRVLTQQAAGWASSQSRVITAARAWPGGPPSAPAWPRGPRPQHLVQVIHQLQLGPALILQPSELPAPGAHLLCSGGGGRRGHLLLGQPTGGGREPSGG